MLVDTVIMGRAYAQNLPRVSIPEVGSDPAGLPLPSTIEDRKDGRTGGFPAVSEISLRHDGARGPRAFERSSSMTAHLPPG